MNLGCATGHPSFVMSNSLPTKPLRRLSCGNTVIVMRKSLYASQALDEKVARLHLDKLGVELEELDEDQADYISVPVAGPYKPEYYRY